MPKTKLQKQKSRKIGNKEYVKYVIVLPFDLIEQLQWSDGDLLIPTVDGKILKIKKAR